MPLLAPRPIPCGEPLRALVGATLHHQALACGSHVSAPPPPSEGPSLRAGRFSALPCVHLKEGQRPSALPCVHLKEGHRASALPCIYLKEGQRASALPCVHFASTERCVGRRLPCRHKARALRTAPARLRAGAGPSSAPRRRCSSADRLSLTKASRRATAERNRPRGRGR